MNKDERIKQILNDMSDYCYCEIYHDCPFESREAHECNRCKAEALYNAGYRKIADDEIVIKKDYLKEELQWLERNARQEQTRKILETIYTYLKGATTQQTTALMIVKALADEHGIKLE